MNETFEQCRKNLLRRGFEVRIAATTEEARQILREEIRATAPETISFGGSMTMEATGIVDELRREGRYRLFDGVDYTLPPEERIEIGDRVCWPICTFRESMPSRKRGRSIGSTGSATG